MAQLVKAQLVKAQLIKAQLVKNRVNCMLSYTSLLLIYMLASHLKTYSWSQVFMLFYISPAAAAKSLHSWKTLRPHRRQPTRLPHPWDSPDKNTGVGCHLLLQCMKVKSESEVAQSCPTLSDPMDCSLPGSSVHGSFQARVLERGAIDSPIYPLALVFIF